MPQIGWFEILIIVAIAIIVIGPKDFPIVLKKIGSWIRSIKKYVRNVQDEVSSLSNESFEEKDDDNKNEVTKKGSNEQGKK